MKRGLSHLIVRSKFALPEGSAKLVKKSTPKMILDSFDSSKINEIALMDGSNNQTLTFGEVHNATYLFANALRKKGVKSGDCVAILSPNHLYYFPVFHGVGLTGAFSTTINPAYTEDEIKYQIEITKATMIVAHPSCLDRALAVGSVFKIPVLSLATKAEGTARHSSHVETIDEFMNIDNIDSVDRDSFRGGDNDKNFDSNSLLTVPFSSGTTGKAKGVMLSHKNVSSNILQIMQLEGYDMMATEGRERGTMLTPLPFFHIYGMVCCMCMSLYAGGKLVLMPSFDLVRYLELIQEQKVTHTNIVPPIVLALAKHPIVDKYNVTSLRSIISGAAPLGAEVQELCSKRLGCLTKQGWGMTELSPLGTVVPNNVDPSTHNLIYGKSGLLAADMEAKIIDPNTGEQKSPLEEGEILIRGPQVMLGYYENEEATRSTLTPDGWLRTGDVGKFDEDGWLMITDRCKELIKYKGFQVPPAELEAVIASMEGVKDCIVIPVLDDEAGELPRAYVVKQDSAPGLTEEEVVAYVQQRVAPHKRLRGGVVFATSVPKSASGKLLRRVQVDIDRGRATA